MRKTFAVAFFVFVSSLPAFPQDVQHYGYPVSTECSMTECVSCHNGRRGRDVSKCTSNRMCVIYGKHIVGVPYPPPGKERSYAPVEELGFYGMELPDNKLACASCHSLTSAKEHLLLVETTADKLCRVCHRM